MIALNPESPEIMPPLPEIPADDGIEQEELPLNDPDPAEEVEIADPIPPEEGEGTSERGDRPPIRE